MLRSIQVLRALAAVGVLIAHADRFGYLRGEAALGAAGVDLFFVISGFIMATTAGGRTPRRFLADRAWRIVPLWLIAVVPWLFVRQNDWQTIATSLTFWPMWGSGFSMPALFVGWSLCFEVLFYVGFAVALARRAAIPLGLFAAALAAAPFLGSEVLSYLGSPLTLEFLAGVAIARLPVREAFGLPLLLVGVVWLAIAPMDYHGIVYGNLAFFRVAAWGLPATLIVYSARCLERYFGRLFDFPVLLGNASYAIYLFHQAVVDFGVPLFPAIGLSLAVGVGVHFAIERPIIAFRRAALAKRPPVSEPATVAAVSL